MAGAVFLALVAVMPSLIVWTTSIEGVYFGGTALLIVVGVAGYYEADESLILMRHYQGF